MLLAFGMAIIPRESRGQTREIPNVLIIYADDLGWSDLGCYGNQAHETPRLDKLASEGMKFTNAYAPAPICSASRASIMTGKSPARLNFEFVATEGEVTDKPLLAPKRTMELPLEEQTLGEVARSAGYTTAYFGKWHIARHNGAYLKWSNTHGPLQQGFETGSDHFGTHPYDPANRQPVHLPDGTFPADSSVLMAIDFLKDQQQSEQPFLLFFSSYYVHTPVIPNNSWLIEKYRNKMPGASENEIKYAAFVETMDHYYGLLLDALKEYGLENNTMVIFTSDNGGHPGFTDNAPLKGNKWNLYEGGIREPLLIRWPGQIPGGTASSAPVIQWDIMPTFCDLVGSERPASIDGESLLPLLSGRSGERKKSRELYWHFPYYHPPKSYEGTKPCSALRLENYKLIYFYEDERTELYDLEKDVGESTDLSVKLPDLTASLKEKLFALLNGANARFPVPNPNYRDKK